MATLKIYKIETNLFRHEPSDKSNWFVSSFYCKTDGDYFQVVESGGSKRGEYLFSDVEVYDIGGSAETFATPQLLMQRLKELGYTGFFREGEVPPQSLGDLTNVNLTSVANGQILKYNSVSGKWENVYNSELTTESITTTHNIDWNIGTHYLTMTANTTLTESNLPSGATTKVISIYITGNFALTLPANWSTNIIGGYDGTVLNQIVVEYISSGVYWVTITQPD